jgi:hypothetical protein
MWLLELQFTVLSDEFYSGQSGLCGHHSLRHEEDTVSISCGSSQEWRDAIFCPQSYCQ